MKIGFDEEVGEENVEQFRKALLKSRSPVSVLETFAFSGASIIPVAPDQKRKEKYHTLRQAVVRLLTVLFVCCFALQMCNIAV